MFSEGIKTLKSIKLSFLLVVFIALSMIAYSEQTSFLFEYPFNGWLIAILPATLGGLAFTIVWVELLNRAKHHMATAYPIIPCSLLACAILITFSFLANNPNNINTTLLIKPSFIYTCTLYIATLLAFEITQTKTTDD